jgi:Uncharacterized alpha/beta hydrolase domain (DUF2235)
MTGEKHKAGADGILEDGVSYYPATAAQLDAYRQAQIALANFSAPILLRSNDPHARLFVASFDGTGNDAIHDPAHRTNISRIDNAIKENGDSRIRSEYLVGPGTQSDLLSRVWDGATGYTYDRRTEEMYSLFIQQAARWKAADPLAEIHVAEIGFSRGAEQAAGFARLVHERGIQDPTGAMYTRSSDNLVTSVTFTKPPIVAPGQVAQVEGLFDAVNTGRPENRDRRPPPSVISGFQIIAGDERRNKFKSDHIIDPGMTPDGRFLGVTVAGAHSDVGGSYHRDGLAVRSDNLMIDYLNALSDKPFLQKDMEPDDPRLNVVHRSEEGLILYRIDRKVDRLTPGGSNELLVPSGQAGHVADPYNAEPRDEALSRRFERQSVYHGAQTQGLRESPLITPNSPSSDMFEALYTAAASKDNAASREVAQAYAQSASGQAFLAQGQEMNQQTRALEQQAALEVQQQAQQAAQRGPSLSR